MALWEASANPSKISAVNIVPFECEFIVCIVVYWWCDEDLMNIFTADCQTLVNNAKADNGRLTIIQPLKDQDKFTWKQIYTNNGTQMVSYSSFDIVEREAMTNDVR